MSINDELVDVEIMKELSSFRYITEVGRRLKEVSKVMSVDVLIYRLQRNAKSWIGKDSENLKVVWDGLHSYKEDCVELEKWFHLRFDSILKELKTTDKIFYYRKPELTPLDADFWASKYLKTIENLKKICGVLNLPNTKYKQFFVEWKQFMAMRTTTTHTTKHYRSMKEIMSQDEWAELIMENQEGWLFINED